MNKIFKVIYSKTKHMYVVASELAKSHSKSSNSNGGQRKAALTLSILLALGAIGSLQVINPDIAYADLPTNNGYYIGISKASADRTKDTNANGAGAGGTNSIAIGHNSTAANNTITIGDRNASASTDSVYIGEFYSATGAIKPSEGKYVTSIGVNSNAGGTGSVAIGSGALADNFDQAGFSTNPDRTSQSIAIGYKAQAKKSNIAIGAGSVATDAASSLGAAKYRETTDADYKATSYVSVGSSDVKRRITNVAAGSDANDAATVGQLEKVAAQKGSWQLTAGGTNKSTVDGDHNKVDFSAGSDGNLSVSKTADSNNVTIGLKKDVTLGAATSGNGGSLDVYRAVADANSDKETNPKGHEYDQLGSHVRIDGSTVSVHYDNGTGNSDARGVVLGVANDSYADSSDSTKTVNSPLGYVYLQDGGNYYYIHGAMNNDTDYQGRLVYNSSNRDITTLLTWKME